jgi:hypothetical protein
MSAEFEIISKIPTRPKYGELRTNQHQDMDLLITDRLKVPGGWIVRSFVQNNLGAPAVALAQTFVPDAGQEWKIT